MFITIISILFILIIFFKYRSLKVNPFSVYYIPFIAFARFNLCMSVNVYVCIEFLIRYLLYFKIIILGFVYFIIILMYFIITVIINNYSVFFNNNSGFNNYV